MPNKLFKILLINLLALAFFAPQALALEIQVDEQGIVRFYQDQVLGEKTNSMSAAGGGASNARRTPTKTIYPTERKALEVSAGDSNRARIQIKPQTTNAGSAGGFSKTEEMEDSRVKMDFPVRTETQTRASAGQLEGQVNQVRAEHQERIENKAELKNIINNQNQNDLELKTGSVRARLNGADFVYQPADNSVYLTTDRGQQKALQHLPDQAVAKMKQTGLDVSDQIDIETQDDKVLYKAKVSQDKKLLGILKRKVESEAVLDDDTGEIKLEAAENTSPLGRLLNTLSF